MHAPWHRGLHAWVLLTDGTSKCLIAAAASWRRVARGSGCTGELATLRGPVFAVQARL